MSMCQRMYEGDGDKDVDTNMSMCQRVYEDGDVDIANMSMCQRINVSMMVMVTGR